MAAIGKKNRLKELGVPSNCVEQWMQPVVGKEAVRCLCSQSNLHTGH
jgi:hypothetical protein